MQDLTPEQITAAEEAMKAHRHEMTRVADFINRPAKDKNGKKKSLSMHMKLDYVACAVDELHERVKNSISLHSYQTTAALHDLYKRVEKLEGKNQAIAKDES